MKNQKDQLICSGALIYAIDTKRILLIHRTTSKYANMWGLVGGKNTNNETPYQGLIREIFEEIGAVTILKTIPLEMFVSNNNYFLFNTYLCIVQNEFIPTLNHEHDGYAWVEFPKWPKPLHPGLHATLNKKSNTEKIKTVFDLIDLIKGQNDVN